MEKPSGTIQTRRFLIGRIPSYFCWDSGYGIMPKRLVRVYKDASQPGSLPHHLVIPLMYRQTLEQSSITQRCKLFSRNTMFSILLLITGKENKYTLGPNLHFELPQVT